MKHIEKLGAMIDEALDFALLHREPFIAHLLSMASLETSEVIERSGRRSRKESERGRKRLGFVN